jgi:hypothetical protein
VGGVIEVERSLSFATNAVTGSDNFADISLTLVCSRSKSECIASKGALPELSAQMKLIKPAPSEDGLSHPRPGTPNACQSAPLLQQNCCLSPKPRQFAVR